VKILQTNFHRGWGGQPARILMLSRRLADRGHDVVLAVPAGSLLAHRAREVGLATYERLAFHKTKHLACAARDAWRLAGHLRDAAYDLIDAHGSQDVWTTVAARMLAGARVPLVFTRHNTKRVRVHPANRWLYGRAVDHLIVASASVLDRYAPFLERGDLTRDRVSVVHSAYRTDRFHPGIDGRNVRADLAVRPQTPLVGVVGRLVRDKGQDDFLRAAALILRQRPDVVFLLVGSGTEEAHLRALSASLGISGSVRFLGFRDDTPAVTAALTVSVLPSVDCDASPAVLKEALACGVPAVATSIGGAAEILRHDETGLIVPPRDPTRLAAAILSLINSPDRARAMGLRGNRDVAARFTPERLADETLAAYGIVTGR
jgi:glycosyltransferase involved in cell wall biosynthesis